ncbi:hypothetical protein [Paludisphaera sp.]|uniref:hypothetical protein n=1 Tax=Paludisphaera sp. TaxID=2017432 RepID=UPI00301BB370
MDKVEELLNMTLETIEAAWEEKYRGVHVSEESKISFYAALVEAIRRRQKVLAYQHGYDMAFLATNHAKNLNPYEKGTDENFHFACGLEFGDGDLQSM